MNPDLMKAVMLLHHDNITTLAEHLHISRQTLSLKIDGISDFKLSEIAIICEKYHLSDSQIIAIFFNGGNYENNGSSQDNGCQSSFCESQFTTQQTPVWLCN